MRKTLIASLTAAAVAMPGAALADEMFTHNNPGAYFGLGLGTNIMEESRWDDIPGHPDMDTETFGTAAGLMLGYRFENGIRVEAEGMWRNNNLDEVSTDTDTFGLGGHIDQYSLMANLLYDFQLGSWFSPYVGAGVGYVWARGGGDLSSGGADFAEVDLDDSGFAYQFIAGASAQLGEGWEGFLDYRYFASEELSGDVETGPQFPDPDFDYDNANHTIMLGVRYAFWQPRAAPAPQPVAQPEPEQEPAPEVEARSYLVFFDWDSAELTEEARSVIRAAADNIKRGGVSTLKVQVTGHADRSGPASYNVGLSERRAEVVRDALVSMGVASGVIGVDWKGETDPLVQTEDGVREPQNRRASIEVAT